MSETIQIDVWSDIACPWCYIGKRRLEQALQAYGALPDALPVEVVYHSFQLAPDLPQDQDLGSQRQYLAQRKGVPEEQAERMMQQVSQVAAGEGLRYDMDAVQMTNTLRAHQLLHFAREHGRQAAMKERMMAAYFSEGRHLGRADVLAELAAEVGLDPAEARAALADDRTLDAVRGDLEQAVRYGIQGVPFFVVDHKYGVSGAQDAKVFLQALTTVQAERMAELVEAEGAPA